MLDKLFNKAAKSATIIAKKEIHKGVNDGVAKGIKAISFVAAVAFFATRGKVPKSVAKKAVEETAKVINNYYIIGKGVL